MKYKKLYAKQSDIKISNNLKSKYDSYYNSESEWRWIGGIDKCANIIDLCRDIPHAKILDIGSGEGAVLQNLSDMEFSEKLYSLEISNKSVNIIRQRKIKNLCECSLFDGYNIPYDDLTFDLVILTHVIEHVEYPRKLLYEANRVARYIFVEVPLELNKRLSDSIAWALFNKIGHIDFYSLKTIRWLLKTSEFKILLQKVTNPSYKIYKYQFGKKAILRYLPKEILLRIMPNLATLLFTYNCSLLCQIKR